MTSQPITAQTIDPHRLAGISSFGSQDVVFRGNLESSNPDACFRLEGEFYGDINFSSGGIVHIAKGAKFDGGFIKADLIYVEGKVNGDIMSRVAVEITASAVVKGKVSYDGELDIHKNARIRAELNFTGDMEVEQHSIADSDVDSDPAVGNTLVESTHSSEAPVQNVVHLVTPPVSSPIAFEGSNQAVHGHTVAAAAISTGNSGYEFRAASMAG